MAIFDFYIFFYCLYVIVIFESIIKTNSIIPIKLYKSLNAIIKFTLITLTIENVYLS